MTDLQTSRDTEMDLDDDGSQHPAKTNDFGIQPDFDVLEEEDKEVCLLTVTVHVANALQNDHEDVGRDFEGQISRMKAELEKLAPNMKAIDRYVVKIR